MIRILPKPQHIEEQEGTLLLDYHCRITIEDRCPRESLFYAQQLAEQIKKMTGIEPVSYTHLTLPTTPYV